MRLKKISIAAVCCAALVTGLYFTPWVQRLLPPSVLYGSRTTADDVQDVRGVSKRGYRSHDVSPPIFKNLRYYILQELEDAGREQNFPEAARINSYLAADAFNRAQAMLRFWMQHRDPATKLFPAFLYRDPKFWDYRNVAADLFPFLLIAASHFDDQAYARLLETLESEARLSQALPLPLTVELGTGALIDEGLEEQIFGAAEYIKDGLVPLTEKLGQGPWLERMEFLMARIWAAAPQQTSYGVIPSNLAEPNGDLLQGLCRLYTATGKSTYLEWAERIGDVYLLEILPRSGFLPPKEWDFETGSFASNEVWLRDHGNELITGLAELSCIECLGSRPRCGTYLTPLLTMMDLLLEKGRNKDGLWFNALDRNGEPLSLRKGMLCDNWGYLYAAYLALAQVLEHKGIPNRSITRYREEARRTLENIHNYTFFPWERKFEMDGQADSIESAFYLLNRIPVSTALRWTEEEIGAFFSLQKPDGSINKDYLDGNFIRTSMIYGLYKTQGAYVKPWREDVRVGAYRSPAGIYFYLESEHAWQGKLYFDHPRHLMTSAVNYPRVNEWPEWFAVNKDAEYLVTDIENNTQRAYRGSELINGISISLAGHDWQSLLIQEQQ